MSVRSKATVEDLYHLPENGKAEIVNGELVLMPPTGWCGMLICLGQMRSEYIGLMIRRIRLFTAVAMSPKRNSPCRVGACQ